MIISDYLLAGADNAQTAKELSALLGCDERQITLMIEKERQDGIPICAICTGKKRGFFKPLIVEEHLSYVKSLEHRINEMQKTLAGQIRGLENFSESQSNVM